MRHWSAKTELPVERFLGWLDLARGKYFTWRQRYGKANEHNAWVPPRPLARRVERHAILDFHVGLSRPGQGRTPRALEPSAFQEGHRFQQPLAPHQHWHVDVSYLNLSGTFYYLCSVLDGASQALLHWQIRESMTETDIERILQRAREQYPQARPRTSPTTVPNSSPRTSRSSSASPA